MDLDKEFYKLYEERYVKAESEARRLEKLAEDWLDDEDHPDYLMEQWMMEDKSGEDRNELP